ncbi:hypothetical protein PACTADRAFT_78705 [Pachysolen tannophilus NRRL Y-2460]|uniref:B30.2/SPRY domain-containing protein n=1 Tax=Pachysolen tannophilus NRRL Y-2460 TaxID=669874 RepID=A0A1E4U2U6_PACTA|nr:hypothetical protein PACTADRAFT_78705 [Pachysolen tannophilus NRRL Y-2460]
MAALAHEINIGDPINSGPDDLNLPFLIGLSSTLSFVLLILLILSIYYIFFNDFSSSSEFFGHNSANGNILNIPDNFNYDENQILENESIYLKNFNKNQLFYYNLGKKFQKLYKPILKPMGNGIDLNVELLIRDRGIKVFYFEQYVDQIDSLLQDNNDNNNSSETTPMINNSLTTNTYYGSISGLGNDLPYIVEDKTDITFLTDNPSTTILNLPLPTKNRNNDTVYFEVKLFDFDYNTTKINIGLSTKPAPNFRLPGEYYYSFGVETSGFLKINNPFNDELNSSVLTPQLIQGDVIGIGFKSNSGTVFVTHNGKKVADILKKLKTDLYPCIGAVGAPCKVQVNLGDSGFVFIEANVKRLGFCENNNEGHLGAPPFYDDVVAGKIERSNHAGVGNNNTAEEGNAGDVILQQGEALPPEYPIDEETFFGPKALLETRNKSQPSAEKSQHLLKMIPDNPPNYKSNASYKSGEKLSEEVNSSQPSSSASSSKSSTKKKKQKIQDILNRKNEDLKNQQEIPDSLLTLNERIYEHKSSDFDRNENGDVNIDSDDNEQQNSQITNLLMASNNSKNNTDINEGEGFQHIPDEVVETGLGNMK